RIPRRRRDGRPEQDYSGRRRLGAGRRARVFRPDGGPTAARGGRATVPTVHRCVVLRLAAVGALAACPGDEPAPEAPGAVWVTPPGSTGFPLGALRGRLGRSQGPQPILALGIASGPGFQLAPLRLPTAWPVPGEG